jgi:hypothetical protein
MQFIVVERVARERTTFRVVIVWKYTRTDHNPLKEAHWSY